MVDRNLMPEIYCEWGEHGVRQLAELCEVIVIVDVLSFTTAVEVAASNGSTVFPYRFRDETAAQFAGEVNAELARGRGMGGYSLSPASLMKIEEPLRLVLPSPNGSTLSLATGDVLTVAGCLRNASAVADYAQRQGRKIGVVPAGERWPDYSLRPALEDILGAGAILSCLGGIKTAEAQTAVEMFEAARPCLQDRIMSCVSGIELVERGYERDVQISSDLDASACVPVLLRDKADPSTPGAYVDAETSG
jgi:2-phosphosulfolactate phosphatase